MVKSSIKHIQDIKMAKLKGSSKLSSKVDNQEAVKKMESLTTSSIRTNITTGLSPKTFRLTLEEVSILKKITHSLQQETSKNITQSKVIRGLIWFANNQDNITNELLDSIYKHT